MSEQREFGIVERSIKDLTRIEKITKETSKAFISKFARKYKIPRGNEASLLKMCLEEIKKIESEKNIKTEV